MSTFNLILTSLVYIGLTFWMMTHSSSWVRIVGTIIAISMIILVSIGLGMVLQPTEIPDCVPKTFA